MSSLPLRALGAAISLAAVGLLAAGCGSGTAGSTSSGSSGTMAATPTTTASSGSASTTTAGTSTASSGSFSVAGIAEDPTLHALLPSSDRTSLTVGTGLEPTELPYVTTVDGQPSGLQPQLYEAVGRILGVKIDASNATFEEIIPGVQDGKFQLGIDNFGVTAAREKIVDFVTYFGDGQSFIVPSNSSLKPVTGPSTITRLCGLTIGTGAGTTFQQILEDQVGACKKIGKPAFKVSIYSDATEPILALKEGRIDAYMGPSAGNHYLASHESGLKFLSQYSSTPVGFVLAKGSPLDKPVQAAINALIKNGDYTKILKSWGIQALAVSSSEINPKATL
jgi:polar amino acid transport system substrate-binding protein